MNKQVMLALFAGILLASNVYASRENYLSDTVVSKRRHKAPGKIQYGTASFYANKFNGRRMANGEIFSQQKLTAASNTLPLNTWVKVTNLRNKKTVIVRITDRMHWRNKRLIDLSKAAAHKLGYTGWGLTHVRIDVLGKKKPPEANLADDK
ncbi:MAG: septal ring lytic transglycosylase RlpA family protein [Bacteroidetes bacterium]|nr:septal ring lytic transglycosylase RlpA family protein [Bacteroidota bacterium]